MELQQLLKNFLNNDGQLTAFPSKRKMKFYALMYLAPNFKAETKYTEKEVNEIINRHITFNDAATLRREMYDYRFLGRDVTGQTYWLEDNQPVLDDYK